MAAEHRFEALSFTLAEPLRVRPQHGAAGVVLATNNGPDALIVRIGRHARGQLVDRSSSVPIPQGSIAQRASAKTIRVNPGESAPIPFRVAPAPFDDVSAGSVIDQRFAVRVTVKVSVEDPVEYATVETPSLPVLVVSSMGE